MRVSVVADFNWESKLDHAMRPLDLKLAFASKDYGPDVQALVICLMCRGNDLKFRQRVRYEKADATISLDVMLDIEQFVHASHEQRRHLLARALVKEVPAVLAKREFKRFDLDAFSREFEAIVDGQLCALDANRFDHLSLEQATGYGG